MKKKKLKQTNATDWWIAMVQIDWSSRCCSELAALDSCQLNMLFEMQA